MNDRGRVLVTGGTGYVGSAIVAALLGAGYPVRVMSRHPTSNELFGANYFQGDMLNEGDVQRALAGIDDVVHLAGVVPGAVAWNEEMTRINSFGTLSLVREARRRSVKRFIYLSSDMVYGETVNARSENAKLAPQGEYGWSKLAGEQWITTHSPSAAGGTMETMILRASRICGPSPAMKDGLLLHALCRRVVAGERLSIYAPERVISLIDIADFQAILGLLLAQTDGDLWGRSPAIYNLPPGALPPIVFNLSIHSVTMQELARMIGQQEPLIELDGEYYARGGPTDGSKLLNLLGYTPRPLENTVQNIMRHYEARRQ